MPHHSATPGTLSPLLARLRDHLAAHPEGCTPAELIAVCWGRPASTNTLSTNITYLRSRLKESATIKWEDGRYVLQKLPRRLLALTC